MSFSNKDVNLNSLSVNDEITLRNGIKGIVTAFTYIECSLYSVLLQYKTDDIYITRRYTTKGGVLWDTRKEPFDIVKVITKYGALNA